MKNKKLYNLLIKLTEIKRETSARISKGENINDIAKDMGFKIVKPL